MTGNLCSRRCSITTLNNIKDVFNSGVSKKQTVLEITVPVVCQWSPTANGQFINVFKV